MGARKINKISKFILPVLVINGDNVRVVPNSNDMSNCFPNTTLHIYKEVGHGAVYQHHEDFMKRALQFLAD